MSDQPAGGVVNGRVIAMVAGLGIIVLAVVATAIPVHGVLGLDPAYFGALEVAVATLLATVLVWYALR